MKLLTLTLAALLLASTADAAAPRRRAAQPTRAYESAPMSTSSGTVGMAGCGLGSMVVEDRSKWSQVASAFLNGTGMQTFGISFGTSNCTEDGVAQVDREKDAFVEANLSDIRRDVAAGEGEYLSSLASLYGCEVSPLGQALQRNQDKLVNVQAIDEVAAEVPGCQG